MKIFFSTYFYISGIMQINSINKPIYCLFYHAPFIPGFWAFSLLCAGNVCTPMRCSYTFYAKLKVIWTSYHIQKIMLLCGFDWHSRYSIGISTFILINSVWFTGSSCNQQVPNVFHWIWFILSHIACKPNAQCIHVYFTHF